jgi:hypothetical protein
VAKKKVPSLSHVWSEVGHGPVRQTGFKAKQKIVKGSAVGLLKEEHKLRLT